MITNPISSSRLKKSGLRRSIIGASAIGSMGAARDRECGDHS